MYDRLSADLVQNKGVEMSHLTESKKLEACRHCLIGTVTLETHTQNVSRIIGGPLVLKKTEECYCDNCGTLFHAPTMLAKLAAKKP
jgi:hypothetical protein